MQRMSRMKKELKLLEESPPHGISCWVKNDKLDCLEAQIIGTEGTPYAAGIFKLEITIPERYPFEPPKVQFVTPIYHPNIDSAGRICLDSLKMPPKGAWKPALNISTLLTTIQLLMNDPNPEDPLMADISNEFKYNRPVFNQKAEEWTKKHAFENNNISKQIADIGDEHATKRAASDSEEDSSSSDDENMDSNNSGLKRKTESNTYIPNKKVKLKLQ